jgi:hypothetical protein
LLLILGTCAPVLVHCFTPHLRPSSPLIPARAGSVLSPRQREAKDRVGLRGGRRP